MRYARTLFLGRKSVEINFTNEPASFDASNEVLERVFGDLIDVYVPQVGMVNFFDELGVAAVIKFIRFNISHGSDRVHKCLSGDRKW